MTRTPRIFLPYLSLACALIFQGCSLQDAYVKADRQTYEVIAPEYLRYVRADESLSDAQKRRREAKVRSWDARTSEGEK